jgi:subtilisin family serine protease
VYVQPHSRQTRNRRFPRLPTIPLALGALLLSTLPAMADRPSAAADFTELVTAAEAGTLDRFVVVLREQADLSAAEALATKREKGRFVFEALRATAARTQPAVRATLEAQGYGVRSFFVANELLVEAPAGKAVSAASLQALAARPDVGRVLPVRPAWIADGRTITPEPGLETTPDSPWTDNVVAIGARDLQLAGTTGKRIVVGISDSGVHGDHPALRKRYRGRGTRGHDYHWFDPTLEATRRPTDTNGHGTHVAGIAVGSTSSRRIGVAPGATWIGCRALGPGASRETVLACLQWFLAPTDLDGRNPDPDRAPDVTNHSYICPFCELQTAFASLQAAGIFSVSGSGNFGPTCGSVFDPGTYAEVTGVGATRGDRNSELASFSSVGPNVSPWLKPNLVAPGEAILSAVPPNRYGRLSGTSFAAPHVAGAVALLWDRRPELRGHVLRTRRVLYDAAYPRNDGVARCPGPPGVPNHLFGWGFLDVYRAACEPRGCG